MPRDDHEQRLLHALSLAVLATDEHGRVTFANDAAVALFGRDDLVGLDLAGLLPGVDPLGERWRGDVPLDRRDGERIIVAVTTAPMPDGGVVSLEDVTQVRRLQAETVAYDHRLRLAHAAAELGTWHWNLADDSNVWDDQLLRIYGLTRETFDGSWDAWVASIHPDDRGEVLPIVQQAMEERSSYALRNRIIRPDGTIRWIEAHGKVLTDADGDAAGTIGCVQDVTERVLLERRVNDISEQLQASLVASSLPDVEGVEVAAHYAAGGDDLEHVGGDWYDVVPTSTGGLVLVIGDVMGRGVRAATMMIHVRAGIRGLLTIEPTPARLLEAADELVTRDAPDHFVTAAVARVDPVSGIVDLASAGHVPGVLVAPDGTATLVGADWGAPLGVVEGEERTSHRIELERGSVVVLVTDGVVESRADDVDEGLERLRRRAAELRDRPLDELVAGLAALADGDLHDDVTVLAVRLR